MNLPSRSNHSGGSCPSDVPHEVVRDHVARILQTQGFVRSERLKRFLSYTVERFLAGESDNLKEYSIALEVFDRSPNYNPKIDALVRVEARRLRSRLARYYATEGLHESIHIQFPSGAYVPLIVRMKATARAEPPLRTRRLIPGGWWLLAGCLAVLAVAVVIWRVAPHRHAPAQVIRLVRDSAAAFDPAVSADGKKLAYASDQSGNVDIWVRPLDSGEERRLTSDPSVDASPDFSPDSTQVLFRSDRNGGGVYVVPFAGGVERLIAPLGKSPKFSPDGRWIAYWAGEEQHFEGKIFIVPSTGGNAVQVGLDLADAKWPVWSSDGKALLVYGSREPPHDGGIISGPTDVFLVPISGGASRETGWTAALRRANIWSQGPVSWNGAVLQFQATTTPPNYFTGVSQEVANLWQVRLPQHGGRVEGEPRRVTFGAALERNPVLLPDGGTIYSSSHYTLTSFDMPLEKAALPRDPFHASFSSPGSYIMPRISRDGSTLVALSDRSGHIDIWLKDLRTGKERAVTSTSIAEHAPQISSDGRTIYFSVREGALYPMYQVNAQGGPARKVCADCQSPSDISPENDYVLYHAGEPWSAYGLNLATGSRTLIVHHNHRTYCTRFSPDGKWISFVTDNGDDASPRRIFVAPFLRDRGIPESEWIPINDGQQRDLEPSWSADGGMLYFFSDRDGNRCIWAIRLDRRSKHPIGDAFPVLHLHRRSTHIPVFAPASVFAVSAAHGRLIFGAMELSSTIYRVETPE